MKKFAVKITYKPDLDYWTYRVLQEVIKYIERNGVEISSIIKVIRAYSPKDKKKQIYETFRWFDYKKGCVIIQNTNGKKTVGLIVTERPNTKTTLISGQ